MKAGLFLTAAMILSVSCQKRSYNSETANTQTPPSPVMLTIKFIKFSVKQPMIAASVDEKGECRGGTPKYQIVIPNNGFMPLFKVSNDTKRICLGGQATPTGQDFQYWDLPANLPSGEYVVWGDKVITNDEWIAATTGTPGVDKKIQLRSKQGLNITVDVRTEKTETTRNITSFRVAVDQFGPFRTVVTLKCQANHYPRSWSYESSFTNDASQGSGGAPFTTYDFGKHQIEYKSQGGDEDKCRVELSLVKDGVWQTDTINGTNNFVLEL